MKNVLNNNIFFMKNFLRLRPLWSKCKRWTEDQFASDLQNIDIFFAWNKSKYCDNRYCRFEDSGFFTGISNRLSILGLTESYTSLYLKFYSQYQVSSSLIFNRVQEKTNVNRCVHTEEYWPEILPDFNLQKMRFLSLQREIQWICLI